jgi:hypothetical protein
VLVTLEERVYARTMLARETTSAAALAFAQAESGVERGYEQLHTRNGADTIC